MPQPFDQTYDDFDEPSPFGDGETDEDCPECGDGDGGDGDEGWYCPACDGDVIPMGSLGQREHGRCRNCGMDSSRDRNGAPAWRESRDIAKVSIPMNLADRFLKTEGCHCQMEEPEDGHFYGKPKPGNVTRATNPGYTRKNSNRYYGEHDAMFDGFPADDGEEGGDGEGEATGDATASLPAMSRNGMPPAQGGCTDEGEPLGPGGNLKQATAGTGGFAMADQSESKGQILSRVRAALREMGDTFPSKAKVVGGDGRGQATKDKKDGKLQCESTFEEFLLRAGL